MDYIERRYVAGLYYAFGYNDAQEDYRTTVNPTEFAEFYAEASADEGPVQDVIQEYLRRVPAAPAAV